MPKTRTERQKRFGGRFFGLAAFEKISAVEGILLTQDMRRDLQALEDQAMTPRQRSRFVTEKYGKTSA